MNARWTLPAASALLLSACSGMLQNRVPEPDVYRLMPTSLHVSSVTHDAVLVVARPGARPGLDSDHLAVTLADRRSDVYAGARWEASVPRMVEGLLVDALRSTATARAVVSEHSAFRGIYCRPKSPNSRQTTVWVPRLRRSAFPCVASSVSPASTAC